MPYLAVVSVNTKNDSFDGAVTALHALDEALFDPFPVFRMNIRKYVLLVVVFIVSIGQVAWAPFLIINGYILPIVAVMIWLVSPFIDFQALSLLGFFSGLIVDLTGPGKLGMYTISLMIATGLIHVVENYTVKNKYVARILSFFCGVLIYFVALRLIGRL